MSSVSGAHRDSRIEGLDGTPGGLAERRDGVMVLGVDSVTVVVIVGNDSGGPMGEGPGKGGGTNLIGLAEDGGRCGTVAGRSERNSIDRREGLDTEDSGSATSLAIIVVETDGVLSMSVGELIVEKSSGYMTNPGSMKVTGGSGIGSTVTVGSGTAICTSSTGGGGVTISSPGGGTTPSTGWMMTCSTGSGTAT